jgi:hypothetical protein
MTIKKIIIACLVFFSIQVFSQINVKAYIDHISVKGNDTKGNIVLNVSGGNAPYTYTWNPGNINQKDFTNISFGNYTVTVKDNNNSTKNIEYSLGYKSNWYNFYGTKVYNDTLNSDGSTVSGSRTAYSKNTLLDSTDGWVQYILPDYSYSWVLGFTDSIQHNYKGTINDINFAFHLTSSNILYVWSSGNWHYIGNTNGGDVIRMERIGSMYYLKQNGVTKFTASTSLSKKLKLKTMTHTDDIVNVGVSFSDSAELNRLNTLRTIISHIEPNGNDSLGSIKVQPLSGNYPYTYSWSPTGVTEDELNYTPSKSYSVNISDNNNDTITKIFKLGYKTKWHKFYGSSYNGDTLYAHSAQTPTGSSSAVAINELRPNKNGWLQYIISEYHSPYIFGFLDSIYDSNKGDHSDFDFAFHITSNNASYAYAGGNFTWLGYYHLGDVLQLEKTGSVFSIKRNGVTTYTYSANNNKNYFVKANVNENYYLSRIGMSFADSSTANSLNVIANIKHFDSRGADSCGSIQLRVSGGSSPYSYTWQPVSSNNKNLHCISAGLYTLTLKDNSGNTYTNTYFVGNEPVWASFYGTILRNDSIIPYGDLPGGWPSAQSGNETDYNGDCEAELILKPLVSPYVVGFLDTLTEANNGNTYDMSFAFHLTYGNYLYAWYDNNWHYQGEAHEGDAIRISREGGRYRLFKNGSIIFMENATSQKKLKLGVQLIEAPLYNLGINFMKKIEVDYVKGDISHEEPNSGYISLEPKYGLKPYKIKWSNNSTSNEISELGTGTYSVYVTDSLKTDTVKLTFHIGEKTRLVHGKNIAENLNKLTKNEDLESAHAFTDYYLNDQEEGYYEFRLKEKNTNFIFALNNFQPDSDFTKIKVPKVITKIVKIAWTDLPTRGTSEYLKINFADTLTTGDSANVIQKEFVKNINDSTTQRFEIDGFHFDYGNIYALPNGYSIKKGIAVNDNDLLSLHSDGNEFEIKVNTISVFTEITNNGGKKIGNLVLNSPYLQLSELIVSPRSSVLLPHFFNPCHFYPNDVTRNWNQTTIYDGNGNIVSDSRTYSDYSGKNIQTQFRNLSSNNILAVQNLFDAYGRLVGTTLPAPINQQCFSFKTGFITTQNNSNYTYNNFDIPNYTSNQNLLSLGESDKPESVGNTVPGTLGWYYSNNNSQETYVPSAQTPYSRVHFSKVDPSSVYKSSNPGKNLGSGSNHEAYQFMMATAGELNTVFGAGYGWRVDEINNFNSLDQCLDYVLKPLPLLNTAPLTLKSIQVDENGIENVAFYDLTGNHIASCIAGKENGNNVKLQTVQAWLSFTDETKRYLDIHLPDGCQNSLAISYPNGNPSGPSNTPIFNFINLKTGEYVKFGSSIDFTGNNPNLPSGYYRMFVKFIPANQSGVNVIYNLNYYNFSLNYYDYANRLKAVVSPKGVEGGNYVFYGEHARTVSNRNFNIVATSDYQPLNFPTDTSWSIQSGSFSNEVSLNLPSTPGNKSKFINLKVSIGDKFSDLSGLDTTGGKTPSDSRCYSDSTAIGNYIEQTFAQDSSGSHGPIADTTIFEVMNIPFYTKLALLDVNDSIISESVQEKTQLTCRISKFDTLQYIEWFPVDFEFNTHIVNTQGGTSINAPWYKVKIIDIHPVLGSYNGYDFSKFIDVINQLKLTVQSTQLTAQAMPNFKMIDRYRYNSLGDLWNANETDAGLTDYVYSNDGRLRFTQNSKQDNSHFDPIYRKFSFIDYDDSYRPTNGGEFQTNSNQTTKFYFESYQEYETNQNPLFQHIPVHHVLEIKLKPFFTPLINDETNIVYDRYDPNLFNETGLVYGSYIQKRLAGRVSYSYNNHKKTWYSYDEFGRIEWVIQKYFDVNPGPNTSIVKTYNYKYDLMGNITEVAYNKENSVDRFFHWYEFDSDKRLKRVYTGRNSSEKILQAKYDYYLHGPLKRVELANKMQALDFVYTINGWLKTINAPEMSESYDPGKDGYLSASITNSTYKDIFGLAKEYYLDDYERAGTNIQSYDDSQNGSNPFSPDLFNGISKAERWQTRTPGSYSGLSYPNQQLMYGYKYDKKYQLKDARFATITSNGTQNKPIGYNGPNNILTTNLTNDYRVHNLTYDLNGNILTLSRNAWQASPNGLNLDNLTYHYNSCSNKLNYVADAVGTNPYNKLGFKPGQNGNNYLYNNAGEITQDNNDNKKYEYNSLGNITVLKDASNNLIATYTYDEAGYRIMKTAYLGGGNIKYTLYIRDAAGNIITTFEKTSTANNISFANPNEWNIYAGSRIGILDKSTSTETYVYELGDQLGNVRATFKKQNKTNLSTNFEGTGADDNWFTAKPGNLLPAPFPYTTGNSVKTQQPNMAFGSGSKFIPVKNGDNITISWKHLFQTTGAPAGGMVIQLTDAAGNILPNCWQIVSLNGTQNNWNSQNLTYNVSANYPEMYLSFFPWNLDNSGAIVWYDDMSVSFTSGNVQAPEQLNMATYYPHGSVMPGMNYNTSYTYKYGYQGQFAEMDAESNENFFELRNYDALLGRFKTTDPYAQFYSPYLAMGNSHPNMVDPDGGIAGWEGLNATMSTAGKAARIAGIIASQISGEIERNTESLISVSTPTPPPTGFYIIPPINYVENFWTNINNIIDFITKPVKSDYNLIYGYGPDLGGGKSLSKNLLKNLPKLIKSKHVVKNAAKRVGKSINQLNKLVKTGKAPKSIKRFDKGKDINQPVDHVHFKDGGALRRDGVWRHGGRKLTNEETKFLKDNGWTIPH